ncbi:MAG: RNB domain-containing ribonuclease [Paracoccaceae bacterium]
MIVRTSLLDEKQPNYFTAKLIKPLKNFSKRTFGISNCKDNKVFINPTNRIFDFPIYLEDIAKKDLKADQILEVEIPLKKIDDKIVVNKIEKMHGDSKRTDLYSYLSAKELDLSEKFPNEVIYELNKIKRKKSLHEINLTKIPFVTIDPINAKDRDDAIFAHFPISKYKNKIFCEIWIAIADVSSFFEISSKLDNEALFRGNSTYLFDTVIPMLPKEISNDLCSLEEKKIKYAIAVKIAFDEKGNKLEHTFYKGKIKVRYNLNYDQVEELITKKNIGNNSKVDLVKNLYLANKILKKINSKSLDIKISEPKIINNISDNSLDLNQNKPLTSHKLVENFMIIANSCVGETLSKSNYPLIYRYHEKPNIFNINKLNRNLSVLGLGTAEKKTQPIHFNQLLTQKTDTNIKNLVSLIILQNMSQAYYSSDYSGHYGLSLNKYVHFTSPIRRYADLLIHRQLHLFLGWNLAEKRRLNLLKYNQISAHISSTERKSIKAERQTHYRYLASYMIKFIDQKFDAIIYTIINNRVFFFLKENHIQGECIFKELPNYTRRKLKRKKTIEKLNMSLSIGDLISVKLISTNTFNGKLFFEYQEFIEKFKVNKNSTLN